MSLNQFRFFLKEYVRGKFDILIFRKGTPFYEVIYANSHGLTSFFQNQCKSSYIPLGKPTMKRPNIRSCSCTLYHFFLYIHIKRVTCILECLEKRRTLLCCRNIYLSKQLNKNEFIILLFSVCIFGV